MLHIFRRHVAGCAQHEKRTGGKCPSKPPCPVHIEGVDGQGGRRKPQALIDPRTGNISEIGPATTNCSLIWSRRNPSSKLKCARRSRKRLGRFHKAQSNEVARHIEEERKSSEISSKTFMEGTAAALPVHDRNRVPDLTDLCSTWTGANRNKISDLGILTSFLKYCNRADFTPKNIGEGLFKTMHWPDDKGQREPFTAAELEAIWEVLPSSPTNMAGWAGRSQSRRRPSST